MKNATTKPKRTRNRPGSRELVRRAIVRRGEYWVFSLLDPAGDLIGNTFGGIVGKTFEVPATLAFNGRAPGLFESAEHGVVIYRQSNTTVSQCRTPDDKAGRT